MIIYSKRTCFRKLTSYLQVYFEFIELFSPILTINKMDQILYTYIYGGKYLLLFILSSKYKTSGKFASVYQVVGMKTQKIDNSLLFTSFFYTNIYFKKTN